MIVKKPRGRPRKETNTVKKNEGSTDEILAKYKRGPKPKAETGTSIACKVIIRKPRGRQRKDNKRVKLEAGQVN